jgi:Right handed beta helix region
VRIAASHVTLRGLLFDGPTGPATPRTAENPRGEEVQVWITGRAVEIASSEIRDSAWHAGVFVTADGARLVGNHIHDNGDRSDPRRANLDHGIYWDRGRGGLVANNLIERNVTHGVQLYRAPAQVRVVHNTIVRNGRAGLVIAADAAGNEIANNLVAFNGRPDITHDLRGKGNLLVSNLFWRNGDAAVVAGGPLRSAGNLAADPRLAAPGDHRLGPRSPARERASDDYRVPTDLRGASRPDDESADIGALEAP